MKDTGGSEAMDVEQNRARPRPASMEPEVFDDICKKAKTHFNLLSASLDKLCHPAPVVESTSNSSATFSVVPESDTPEAKDAEDELPDYADELKDEQQDMKVEPPPMQLLPTSKLEE